MIDRFGFFYYLGAEILPADLITSGLFEETSLPDMEFIKHFGTGIILDLRNLARISKYEDFLALCSYLEEEEKKLCC